LATIREFEKDFARGARLSQMRLSGSD
jgi:hypothetical protein